MISLTKVLGFSTKWSTCPRRTRFVISNSIFCNWGHINISQCSFYLICFLVLHNAPIVQRLFPVSLVKRATYVSWFLHKQPQQSLTIFSITSVIIQWLVVVKITVVPKITPQWEFPPCWWKRSMSWRGNSEQTSAFIRKNADGPPDRIWSRKW